MGRSIKVRGVPDHVHARLKSQAESTGLSLSAFLRWELAGIAERPHDDEAFVRSVAVEMAGGRRAQWAHGSGWPPCGSS
ncbi:MAG TPA: hypothetical protein VF715_00965 [Thermoleophilaceae bacterium]